MEHQISVHRDLLTVFIIFLPNVEEGLQANSLYMRSFKHLVNIVNGTVKSRVVGRTKDYLALDLAAHCCVVRSA